MSSQDAKKKFEAVFPSLVEDLKENANQYNLPANALKWYEDVCNTFSARFPSLLHLFYPLTTLE